MMKKVLVLFLFLAGMASVAEEAKWMRYPAISPDGSQIVFAYKDDLYRVSATGGQAIQLTAHPAYDYMPVWSPDGKTIAFASDRYGNFDVFTIPAAGGTPTRVTFHSAKQLPCDFTPDGKYILFSATLNMDVKDDQFPSGIKSELYKVPVAGGRVELVLTNDALYAKMATNGKHIVYQDMKGYENDWRKHHTSSVTRDIWVYDVNARTHTKVSPFEGDDMFPALSHDGTTVYFLSEKSGSLNVVSVPVTGGEPQALTSFDKHPMRFLTASDTDTLCFAYNGDIYTMKQGAKPEKVTVTVLADRKHNPVQFDKNGSGAGQMAVSPDGKEVAFIRRGEVYVTSADYSTTRRITNTPEQERSVSFSPDGRSLLYASERNGSWNLYQTSLVRKAEKGFANATLLKEKAILESDKETFQPSYSPDGKEVAFLEERTTLKVLNLESGEQRVILPAKYNYSYADGDQHYDWSPDGNWFAVHFISDGRWSYEMGLVDAKGSQKLINLSKNGYEDYSPTWMMDGQMLIWATDKYGMRYSGGGSQDDILAMFLTKEAWDVHNMSKEEYEIYKEQKKEEEKAKKKAEKEKADDKKDKKKDKKKEEKKDKVEPLKIDFDGIENRVARLTVNSSNLADAVVTKDGEKLYYLSRFEKGYDLWEHDFKEGTTKIFKKLGVRRGSLELSKDGKTLFLNAGGRLSKITLAGGKTKSISYSAEMDLDRPGERAYMFEHVWRQIKKKFYDPNLHGVDWDFYKEAYAAFLPHINNNYDYAEMLSEMLGELNGSHTGSGHRPHHENGDATASLGVFYDLGYDGDGLKIAEIITGSPLEQADSKIKPGTIIEAINGEKILKDTNLFKLMNHKAGKNTLLALKDPETGKTWTEVVKPITYGARNGLLYDRWVKQRRKRTEELSNGRLGYVHVRGMNSSSYRDTFAELFGRFTEKDGIIIDTRFNGGGNLVEQLTALFSGEKYLTNIPRGQYVGIKPESRWTKQSIVLMGESNYSDAHGFPYGYKTLGIGKLVGMPVPGTMTSVWWETLLDPTVYFGIPQVGKYDMEGHYLENQQLEPDVKIRNTPEKLRDGVDEQLAKAVEVLLQDIDAE